MERREFLALLASTLLPLNASAEEVLTEPDFLRPLLDAKALPPMASRIPKVPRVVDLRAKGRSPGSYGGSLRTIIGSEKDVRYLTIYGYTRIVGYDEKLQLQADVAAAFETQDEMIFTFKLREGHRWSDGHPFTVDDFQYWWDDVILNKDLTPGGGALELRPHGKLPRFEIVDPLTVRYSWDQPNPNFLAALAAPQPLVIAGPAHYLKQFHKKYQDADTLKALMAKRRVKKWADLHIKMARSYRPENPDLPVLEPWTLKTKPPAQQFLFDRNPYFHRVDERGQQLPYIDRFYVNVSSSSIIAAKAGAGESDLQATGIDFNDYAFLKDAEKRYPVKVDLWKLTRGSRVALLPNLNIADNVWRAAFRDVRVRRALSLAINRHEINMAVFYGLGQERGDSMLPESPLYKESYATAWASFDPQEANRLLDEAGLSKRDTDGIRLLQDGRRMEITAETAGESNIDTDVLELVRDHWRVIGIALFTRTTQRDLFRSRAMGGRIAMSLWYGLDNGVATADMSPAELAPTMEDQMQWPLWGMHYLSAGTQGTAPDLPEARQLLDLLKQWESTPDVEKRTGIWDAMLSIYTDQVFSIGLVNGTLQPILSRRNMQNVPEKALYGFDPTCYLGIYMPDTFWLKEDH